jgi:hypothetical protein
MDGAAMVTDVYDMDDHDTLSGTINYVKGCCRAKSHGYAPAHDFVYRIVLSSDDDCDTWALSRIMPLNTGFTTFENAWNLNPFTSAAWAWADIDALHAGFEASSPSVTCDTFTFLPVADGDRIDITDVTSGYEHWEAVSAERPLAEVSEVSDVYHYDLYEYLMASEEYSLDNCYSVIKYGDYVLTTDAINNKTFIYAWKNGLVQYLAECAAGGYTIIASTVTNVFYVLKLNYVVVLTYNEATKTLAITASVEIDAVNGSTGQDMIIRDGYLVLNTEAPAGKGLASYLIDVDGTLTLEDSVDTFAAYSLTQNSNYIFAASDISLRAYTMSCGEFTHVASLVITNGSRGLVEYNNVVFLARGTDGLSAYSFDGATFTLEDTVDDGGTYHKLLVANGVLHAGISSSPRKIYAYTYSGGSFSSLIDTYDTDTAIIRGLSYSDGFIFTQGINATGVILTFNGGKYKLVHDIADGMLDKYLTDDILTVSVVAKMGKEYDATDGAEIYGRMIIKTHDTEYTSSEFKLEYPQKWYSYTWSVNPNTTNAWTLEEIKAVQAGVGLKGDGKYAACSICQLVLSSESNVSPEIQTSQVYLKVNYTPDVSTCTLNKPEEVSLDMGRNIQILNFWSGNREVYDESRANKTLVLTGTEYEHDPNFYTPEVIDSTPCERIQCVRSMGEEGAIVTPSGLGWDTGLIDESYRIRSFGWKLIQEKPVAYAWVLELEASE